MKHMEEKILQVLIRALEKFHISERSYSLGEYAEETICLVKNDLSWCVYGGEKGLKHDIKIYEDCKNACLDLISRIAESNDNEKSLKDFFIKGVERIKMKNKVSYSFDNLYYKGIFDTDEEAIDEVLKIIHMCEKCDSLEVPAEVYVGNCEFFVPSLTGSSWDIIDAIQCQAEDEGFGAWAEEYLDVSKEMKEDLEAGLEEVFQKWIENYNLQSTFFKVNVYDIYEYDPKKKKLYKVGNGRSR